LLRSAKPEHFLADLVHTRGQPFLCSCQAFLPGGQFLLDSVPNEGGGGREAAVARYRIQLLNDLL
jgi:hypothetical protein